ncbi:YajQ family cyclic di-GMP-binding protein [Telmatospirillum sp.]|uniref:YajQ family cyclic di-GMP-binding protein n=1 Tax=Telmatospirillum sp. TaxID=2079197 RepID=UPI00284A7F0C|nr:YajQ family cyclic di-GMP-binding protein [Telmatospirillum sp.]MDR3435654.1 YajQ family cyclic di-GMP-binding protein [Telmatospirillum sp.]
MPSFDIVSKTDLAEVDNALAGISREIAQRFDFKGSHCSVERKDESITVLADDDMKLKQMHELLKVHFTRRNVDPRALDFKPVEKASGNSVRQLVVVKQGIDKDLAKTLVKELKDSKIKVQASIQGDELRISGKKRDDLQEAIALVKKLPVDQPLQYVNFRD